MKKVIVFLFVMIGISGCGPSLKEYVAASSHYATRVSATSNITVNIDNKRGVRRTDNKVANVLGSVVNVATTVGAAALSSEQEQRLYPLIQPTEMASLVKDGFEEGFGGATHLMGVDTTQNPDLRIHLTLDRYGIWAESLLSSMNFYVEARIEVIDSASMTTIYTNGVSLMRSASDMVSDITQSVNAGVQAEVNRAVPRVRKTRVALDTVHNVGNLVSGAMNLTAFMKLSDEEIQAIFQYMAFDAGVMISDSLTQAIYQ